MLSFRNHVLDRKDRYTVEYNVGVWTQPNIPNTKLFCFNSLDTLIEYKNRIINNFDYETPPFKYFECEVCNPSTEPIDICHLVSVEYIDLFYKFIDDADDDYHVCPPYGTISCDKIKLLTEIQLDR